MLPRTTHLLAILSFLVEMTISSPVYNMQPAYITATIGSTGRNIRNLPCISRKNNQSGVCMFAIDCLKANGTHLGTCIDRFYFGSCCHIEPLQDITENTIDAALIPSREPPHRIASTTLTTPNTESTSTISTTTKNATVTQGTPSITPEQQQNLESSSVASVPPVSVTQDDTESYKITTFQTVDDVPLITTLKPTSQKPSKTKATHKPVTTVTPSATTKITTKVTKPRPQTTPKPKPTYLHVNATATRPQTTTPRPRPKPTKPIRITKPAVQNATSSSTATPAPQTQKPTTSRSSTTTKSTKLTKRPTIVTKGTTTRKPIITAPSRLPVTITTTKPTTATIKTTNKLTTVATTPTTTTTTTSATSTLSNEVHVHEVHVNETNNEQKQPDINGNPATNEIESPIAPGIAITTSGVSTESTTSIPSLVTWSEINKNNSDTRNNATFSTTTTSTTTASIPSSSTSEDVTNPDDWVPITDGWVLLPSLTTTPESDTNDITTITSSSTEKSEEFSSEYSASSSSTESNSNASPGVINSSTENVTSSTEGAPSSTESQASSNEDSSAISSSTEDTSGTSSTTGAPVATSGLNMSDFTDVCGRRMVPEGRIVGGEKSSFGKWPWQISLRQWRTSTYLHKCGAALLNENWAITAAHCVDNVPPSDLLLRLGEHDLSTESEPYLHQERRVQIVASHPQFDPRTFEYDLALLRFYEPVTFQPNIIPVCVPQTDENFVGRNAHVTGWGRLYEDGPLPSILQEVSVPVINNTVCESMYRSAGYIEHIPNIFICAGWRRGGFDSCEGDSGGPMVIQRPDKRFILAGVISWGIGCAEPNQPGVYTRISEFRDWINQILQF